jgi:hypothetical protein
VGGWTDACCDVEGTFGDVPIPTDYRSKLVEEGREVCSDLRRAWLLIAVSEDDAEVTVDGDSLGLSPLGLQEALPGVYQVSASKPGFRGATDTVTVTPADTAIADLVLVPETGLVDVVSHPSGARLFIDGVAVGVTPLDSLRLDSGQCYVRMERHLHEAWAGSLNVLGGATTSLEISLDEKTRGKALLRSALLPGWGQRYGERKALGWSYTLAQVASLGFATYSFVRYDESLSEYEDAKAAYEGALDNHDELWQDLQGKHDTLRDDRRMRSYAVSFAAGMYVWNLMDTLLF